MDSLFASGLCFFRTANYELAFLRFFNYSDCSFRLETIDRSVSSCSEISSIVISLFIGVLASFSTLLVTVDF